MKVIPLGLQCSVPEGIKRANMRECSYPFDWLWTPSKTAYSVLNLLINSGVEPAVEYMTTGYTYYKYLGKERYESTNSPTESQMNTESGLGITHFIVNDEYKDTLTRRLTRLLRDIMSGDKLLFMYADATNPWLNYYLDDVEYGVDATEYLLKIHELLYPLNNDIRIVYFCWTERQRENGNIEYVPFDFSDNLNRNWLDVSRVISEYCSGLWGRAET